MTASRLDSTAAAEHFFAGAVAAGLRHVVVSPGSRSTPLAVAADRNPDLEVFVHLDERCAAFAALGQAKLLGAPVGLVCTSGTAAANFLPALAEASMSNVSLVAITADRPPEHQHIGVGQTFDQRGLFGVHVRHEMTMPVGGDGGQGFSVRAGWRATTTSLEHHGPVHVNWPFRLPLEPTSTPIDPPMTPEAPVRSSFPPEIGDVDALADELARAHAPLIIAGPDAAQSELEANEIVRVAVALGLPVLADALSGVRGRHAGGTSSAVVLDASSLIVEMDLPTPDVVIRIGNTPTAKSTRLWWETTAARHILIDPLDDWHDPSSAMIRRFRCSPAALLASVADRVQPSDPHWIDEWSLLSTHASRCRRETLDRWPTVTEAHVAERLEHLLGPLDTVVASSSMPVRDIDVFTSAAFAPTVVANRGINGIDGVVSTAVGATRARAQGRTVVLIGDVAALHDVGGILDAARQGIDLTIVIPNNDGGGIFSFLPARDALPSAQFDRLFHTPHGGTFRFLGEHRGITHYDASHDLEGALAAALSRTGVNIVEVPVSTSDRLALHETLLDSLRS